MTDDMGARGAERMDGTVTLARELTTVGPDGKLWTHTMKLLYKGTGSTDVPPTPRSRLERFTCC